MSDTNRNVIIKKLLASTEKVQRQWKALLVSEIAGENISLSQLWALSVIAADGKLNSRRLGELLHVTSGAITQLVDSLVAEGYVSRQADPDDRRVMNLVISPAGKKKFAELQQKRKDVFVKVFSALSDLELTDLLGYQEKMLFQLDHLDAPKITKIITTKSPKQ